MAEVETSVDEPRQLRLGCAAEYRFASAVQWRRAWSPMPLLVVSHAAGTSRAKAILTWLRGSSLHTALSTGSGETVSLVAALHRRTPVPVRNLVVAAVVIPAVAVMWESARSGTVSVPMLLVVGVVWMAVVSVAARLNAGGRGDGYRLTDVRASIRGTGLGEVALAVLVGRTEPLSLTVDNDRVAQMYTRIGFVEAPPSRDGRINMERPGAVRDGVQLRIDAAIACVAGLLGSVVITTALTDGRFALAVSVIAIIWAICIDVLEFRLPNPLLGVGLAAAILAIDGGPLWLPFAAGVVAAFVVGLARVGGGDVKLAAVGGVLLGQPVAALMGVAVGLSLSLATARRRPRPLGPSLAVGLFVILIGEQVR